MRRGAWIRQVAIAASGAVLLAGCGGVRRLAKKNPEAELRLPARAAIQQEVVPADTMPAPQRIISFRKDDGTELFFSPVAIDSLTGEKMMSVSIEEIVISASSRRNLVERNGRINLDFVVTVPPALQNKAWRLVIEPRVLKGPDTLSFDPLVYSGGKFREMQQRDYGRYDAFLGRIVDSAEYFDRFGRKRRYNRWLREQDRNRRLSEQIVQRLEALTPAEAMTDKKVGWMTRSEFNEQRAALRRYVRSTDRKVARMITYTPDAGDRFDHLNDYLAPRYRYEGVEVLPGGEVYTRVEGRYPESDLPREAYLGSLVRQRSDVRRGVRQADTVELRRMARERLAYTGLDRPTVNELLYRTSDSVVYANYSVRREGAAKRLAVFNRIDTASMRIRSLRQDRLERNRELAGRRDEEFERLVRYPYVDPVRLDTVIYKPDGSIQYLYSEQVTADENTSKLYLYLTGEVEDRSGKTYRLQRSDTLTFSVASMSSFVDPTTRYMQRIVTRDAEANARFFFTFPAGKAMLVDTLRENRRQVAAVRELTRKLMTDPIYIIDSITLRATASPEGTWAINERLARDRAEALRRVLTSEFRVLYDSLKISANYTLDDEGREVAGRADDRLPDLPNLLRTQWLAEDWAELRRLVEADTLIADKEQVLEMMSWEGNPDTREWRIRAKYPKAYDRMRRVIYPQMRAVDFRFNLHRRGMQQDTVYTTEVDSNYMHAVELLRKRRYEEALAILRDYDDRNTALAYLSLGYNAAAYRILREEPGCADSPDLQYMLAIVASRMGDEVQAVQYFLRSVELRPSLKFRGSLDPEVSSLIRKYNLFPDDFKG